MHQLSDLVQLMRPCASYNVFGIIIVLQSFLPVSSATTVLVVNHNKAFYLACIQQWFIFSHSWSSLSQSSCGTLALFPDHSQILSCKVGRFPNFLHSCKIKSGSGLGTRLVAPTIVLAMELELCTVKTFGLLQPCFGHLSCMPAECVTHYKLQRDVSYLHQSSREASSVRIFLQKAYSYLVTLLAFLPQPCNQGTPPGTDVQDQRNTNLTRNDISAF